MEWPGLLDPARVIDRLAKLASAPIRSIPGRAEAADEQEARFLLRCLAVAAFAAMNIMLLSVSAGPATRPTSPRSSATSFIGSPP